MRFLIDGNNLMYALADVYDALGRKNLCEFLAARLGASKSEITVVFDGPEPQGDLLDQIFRTGVTAFFSGHRPADPIIIEQIDRDTAPKRLTVVSTDREIRRAAKRRKCKILRSEQFAKSLANRKPRTTNPTEPPEKRHGLTPEETRLWMERFGFNAPKDSNRPISQDEHTRKG